MLVCLPSLSFLRPIVFCKQEHVTYRTSPYAEPNILIAALPLRTAYWEGRVLWRELWNSRNRSVHLFQKSLNPEEKLLHLHMVVLLFLYKEHATPWAPYINTLPSKYCCLSAYPNIVHIIALSYTPRQVDPCMRYFAFVNTFVCPKLSENISVKFYIGFCINGWKSNLILVRSISVCSHSKKLFYSDVSRSRWETATDIKCRQGCDTLLHVVYTLQCSR
jgi:hypothetical protein